METTQETEPLASSARAAAAAGGRQLLAWRDRFTTHSKGPGDFVTDADHASQRAVEEELRNRHPGHAFIGEEQSGPVTPPPAGQIVWVTDPLDGTTNYVHGFPCFGVSVAAVLDGQPIAAAIFDPLRDEMFWAASGIGAWLGEDRISTSEAQSIDDALVALSLPAAVRSDSPDLIDLLRVVPRCRAIRRTGSAALNLAYVATGRLDAHWARQIYPWDVAAGVLLVREAGGVVTAADGGPFDLWRADFIAAANKPLHQEMVTTLAERITT